MSATERDPEQPDPLRPSGETVRETLIERKIREAMEDGAFEGLPHQGARLPLEDDSAAGDWALAHRMLRNAGAAPPCSTAGHSTSGWSWSGSSEPVVESLWSRPSASRRAASGPGPSGRRRQCVRRVKPQIAQVAKPVVVSTSRKLGHPLVPQKMREPLLATDVRRRMRRMELERPARVVVVERDIMV